MTTTLAILDEAIGSGQFNSWDAAAALETLAMNTAHDQTARGVLFCGTHRNAEHQNKRGHE